jgi:hypothetical protein
MPVKVKTAVESRECAFYRMGLGGLVETNVEVYNKLDSEEED